MSKFTQLDLKFETQEQNWIRWAGGYGYLAHLFWKDCMTGRLQRSSIEASESASEAVLPLAKLDAICFDSIVNWLPVEYKKVYLANTFNKVVASGRVRKTRAGDIYHQANLIGISKYKYEQLLAQAESLIKRKGGLA